MAAALSVCCHAGAETLTVASTTATTRVCQTVHVEPCNIHLNVKNNNTFRQFMESRNSPLLCEDKDKIKVKKNEQSAGVEKRNCLHAQVIHH